jgi:hypothetical protein
MVGEGAFWENMLDFYPENTDREAAAGNKTVLNLAGKVLADLRQTFPLLKQNTVMVQGADLALNRILFTAKKNLARIDLFKAYQSGDPADTRLARQEISDLLPDLYTIKKEYVRLWKLENRPWWLDKNMEDYDKLARQMEDVDKVVFIEPQPVVIDGRRPVYLRSLFHDKTIVYTLDGTAPSVTSAVYSSPLMVEGKSVVRACVLENNGLGTVSEMGILVHKGIGSLMKLNSSYSTYNPAYAAGGDQALVDGLKGSSDFADGRWQGYQGQDLDIELDLKQVIPVKSVSADFLQSSDSWILLPKEMQVFSSVDGNSWTLLKSVDHDIPKDDLNLVIHSFKAEFDNLITRYLRIVAKNPGLLPAWHHAAGNPSFIFGDEIIIE